MTGRLESPVLTDMKPGKVLIEGWCQTEPARLL
ncbi:hypothetical protein MCEMAEM6B_02467 [Mycobacteriaceae bacterium]